MDWPSTSVNVKHASSPPVLRSTSGSQPSPKQDRPSKKPSTRGFLESLMTRCWPSTSTQKKSPAEWGQECVSLTLWEGQTGGGVGIAWDWSLRLLRGASLNTVLQLGPPGSPRQPWKRSSVHKEERPEESREPQPVPLSKPSTGRRGWRSRGYGTWDLRCVCMISGTIWRRMTQGGRLLGEWCRKGLQRRTGGSRVGEPTRALWEEYQLGQERMWVVHHPGDRVCRALWSEPPPRRQRPRRSKEERLRWQSPRPVKWTSHSSRTERWRTAWAGEALESWCSGSTIAGRPPQGQPAALTPPITAMGEAVEWLAGRQDEWIMAAVVSDSRSLLDALQGDAGESRLRRLRERLWELSEDGKDVTLVWVPGHCGLPGNEEADRLAGLGCELEQTEAELDGATRRAVIRRGIKGQDVRHERLREVYTRGVREDEESAMRREDRTDLTRFRTGHHPKLRRWQVMVGREGNAECRLCGLGEESSTHLWTECGAVEDLRRRHQLGRTHAELVEQPLRAWAMLRSILSRLGD